MRLLYTIFYKDTCFNSFKLNNLPSLLSQMDYNNINKLIQLFNNQNKHHFLTYKFCLNTFNVNFTIKKTMKKNTSDLTIFINSNNLLLFEMFFDIIIKNNRLFFINNYINRDFFLSRNHYDTYIKNINSHINDEVKSFYIEVYKQFIQKKDYMLKQTILNIL